MPSLKTQMEKLLKVGERLELYMEHKRIGVNQLGRLTHTSGVQISNIIKGKNWGIDKIFILFEALPDLNPGWLLFGEGKMLKDPQASSTGAAGDENLRKDLQNAQTLLAYQEMALDAYKRSMDALTSSNNDLKRMVDFYKERAEARESEQRAKSA